jgi:hypothetical protein
MSPCMQAVGGPSLQSGSRPAAEAEKRLVGFLSCVLTCLLHCYCDCRSQMRATESYLTIQVDVAGPSNALRYGAQEFC